MTALIADAIGGSQILFWLVAVLVILAIIFLIRRA